MLQDVRKMVGIKTGEELEVRRYEQRLQNNPKAGASQYFELGGMHRKTGEKRAAIEAFLHAAYLAVESEDLTIAMAANKAIIQMEPEHKDALANLAYIRFQYGTDVVNKEYGELLQELEKRRQAAQYPLTNEHGEKKVSTDPHSSDNIEMFAEGLGEPLEFSGNHDNRGSERFTRSNEHLHSSDDRSTRGANNRPNAFPEQVCEEKNHTSQRQTRHWKETRKPGTLPTQSQEKHRVFEANRKSLINLIEGTNGTDFSASFELERQALVNLISESDTFTDDVQQASESPIYLSTQSEELMTNTPESGVQIEKDSSSDTAKILATPDDGWIEPDETIDLRSGTRPDVETIWVHLHRCVAFSPLSDSEIRELAVHVRLHELTADSIILHPNGTNRSLYVVFNGDVELSISSERGELVRLHMTASDVFGEHTFWKQHSMAVSATTHTACTLAEIPAATFLSVARKYPVMLHYLKRVCKRRYFAAMLAQTPVFQDCSMKERQTIAEYLSPVHVSQGIAILPEGDDAQDLYIIQSGEVNVFTTFVEDEESPIIQDAYEHVSLDQLGEGDVFGEEPFFTSEPCITTFWARTDVALLKLSGACLSTFVEQFPQFRRRLYDIHQQRTRLTIQAVESVLTK